MKSPALNGVKPPSGSGKRELDPFGKNGNNLVKNSGGKFDEKVNAILRDTFTNLISNVTCRMAGILYRNFIL